MEHFDIVSAAKDEMEQALAPIVAAFLTDPLMRFALPAPHTYLSVMPEVARAFGGASFDHGTAYVTADFRGAALWLPPGVRQHDEELAGLILDTAPPERLNDLLQTIERVDQSHPAEPHWYLSMIGVEPFAQGEGLGGALMRHGVRRCDDEGMIAYLESSNPRNISLYERHGFEAIGEIQIGAAPSVTPMVRQPRTP